MRILSDPTVLYVPLSFLNTQDSKVGKGLTVMLHSSLIPLPDLQNRATTH